MGRLVKNCRLVLHEDRQDSIRKGYNTMAGRKNGVTDSTCESLGVNPALSSFKDAKCKNLSANPRGLMAENPDEALGRSVLCERRTARFSSRGEATLQLYIASGITEE
jgi:hypothetical protein